MLVIGVGRSMDIDALEAAYQPIVPISSPPPTQLVIGVVRRTIDI